MDPKCICALGTRHIHAAHHLTRATTRSLQPVGAAALAARSRLSRAEMSEDMVERVAASADSSARYRAKDARFSSCAHPVRDATYESHEWGRDKRTTQGETEREASSNRSTPRTGDRTSSVKTKTVSGPAETTPSAEPVAADGRLALLLLLLLLEEEEVEEEEEDDDDDDEDVKAPAVVDDEEDDVTADDVESLGGTPTDSATRPPPAPAP